MFLAIKNFFSLLRITHWSKNIFVLLGVFYTDLSGFWPKALIVAFVFSLISSAVYIYNDLCDIEEDKIHPFKKKRALASGKISFKDAKLLLIFLTLISFVIASFISISLLLILIIYVVINILYNHKFRKIPGLDVLSIASGFMLRVLAGTIGIGLPITWWLTVTATLLSLLIALSKRRLEMRLIIEGKSRLVLTKYSNVLLDFLIVFSAFGAFLSYLLYIFYNHSYSFYFILTLPFAAFGLYRFTLLILKETHFDDPVTVFFNDIICDVNLFCFFILTVIALD